MRAVRFLVAAIAALLLVARGTRAYPTGAPEVACVDQLPQHGVSPQSGTGGYTFSFPSLSSGATVNYTSPHPLSIVVQGPQFMGFLISIFSDRTAARIGTIDFASTTPAQYVCTTYCTDCAITHFSSDGKTSLPFTWNPPEDSGNGLVRIHATIVVSQFVIYTLTFDIPEVVGTDPPDVMQIPAITASTTPAASGTDVTIGWIKPVNGSNPIREYLVSMRTVTPIASAFAVIWQGLAYSTILTSLQAGTVYEVAVQANNTYLQTTLSPALQIAPVAVGTAVPPVPPAPATSATPALDSIPLVWDDTGSGTTTAQFVAYQLQMKKANALDTTYQTVYQGLTANATITGLTSATSYSFRQLSMSLAGKSAYSVVFTVSTYGSACSDVGSFTSQGTCRCITGYLGLQCEVASPFTGGSQPCFNDNTYCLDWLVKDDMLYGRIQGQTSPASGARSDWVGLGFGATDGMTGMYALVFTVPTQDQAVLHTMTATGFLSPAAVTTPDMASTSYSGFYNSTCLDIMFVRPLDTGITGAYVITSGSTPVSWAVSSQFFQEHPDTGRGRLSVNFAERTYSSGCGSVGLLTASGTCRCPTGYLGLRCELTSPFVGGSQPCFNGNTYCIDWVVKDDLIYGRIQGSTSPSTTGTRSDWIALGFGASDGMTGLYALVFTVPTQDQPLLRTVRASGFSTPTVLATADMPAANYSGYYNSTGLDIMFVRALNTGVDGAYVITTGSLPVSWAVSSQFFQQHADSGRGRQSINFFTLTAVKISSVSYSFYVPFLVAIVAIVLVGMLFYLSDTAMRSVLGVFFLRARPSSIGATPSHDHSSDTHVSVRTKKTGFYEHLLRFLDTATLDIRRTAVDWTWGEMLAFFFYIVGLLISVAVGYASYDPSAKSRSHYIFGHLVAVQFALLFFPVVRNSIWLGMIGLSYERAIQWHRIIARICLAFVVVHLLSMENYFGMSVLTASTATAYGKGVVYGLIAFIGMCLMTVLSFEPIRRWWWNLFLVSHLILFPVVVIFACLHSILACYYMAVPLLLYVIDRVVRFANSRRSVRLVSFKVSHGSSRGDGAAAPRLVRLEVSLPPPLFRAFAYKPGDYCWINAPSVSYWAWHPFSISSSPYSVSKDTLTYHILDMGPGTWTHHLANSLEAFEHGVDHGAVELGGDMSSTRQVKLDVKESIQFPLCIDGPYGSLTVPLADYSTVVLVAGGIGITPLMSILESLLLRQTVHSGVKSLRTIHLIWVSRSASAFTEWFPQLVCEHFPVYFGMLKLHFFFTGAGEVTGSAPVREVLAASSARKSSQLAWDPAATQPPTTRAHHTTDVEMEEHPQRRGSLSVAAPSVVGVAQQNRRGSPSAIAAQRRSSSGTLPISEGVEVAAARAHAESMVPPPPAQETNDFDDEGAPPPPPPPPSPPQVPSPHTHVLDAQDTVSPYLTNDGSVAGGPPKINIHCGRPALGVLFEQIAQLHAQLDQSPTSPQADQPLNQSPPLSPSERSQPYHAPAQAQHVAVYACGPCDLVSSAQHHAMARGWHLHKETFAL